MFLTCHWFRSILLKFWYRCLQNGQSWWTSTHCLAQDAHNSCRQGRTMAFSLAKQIRHSRSCWIGNSSSSSHWLFASTTSVTNSTRRRNNVRYRTKSVTESSSCAWESSWTMTATNTWRSKNLPSSTEHEYGKWTTSVCETAILSRDMPWTVSFRRYGTNRLVVGSTSILPFVWTNRSRRTASWAMSKSSSKHEGTWTDEATLPAASTIATSTICTRSPRWLLRLAASIIIIDPTFNRRYINVSIQKREKVRLIIYHASSLHHFECWGRCLGDHSSYVQKILLVTGHDSTHPTTNQTTVTTINFGGFIIR